MSAETEESECKCLCIIWLFSDHAYWSFTILRTGKCLTGLKSETKGTVVNGERKSPLAANSYKALTISNHITNFSDHFRKTEKNMEYVYIVRKFVDLHDEWKWRHS